MDQIDRKIISSLVKDGRISFRDLGNRIHLSPNATAERVRRLRSAGAIKGFHAHVNPALLGFSLEAFIDIKLQPGTTAKSFEADYAIARDYQRRHLDRKRGFSIARCMQGPNRSCTTD